MDGSAHARRLMVSIARALTLSERRYDGQKARLQERPIKPNDRTISKETPFCAHPLRILPVLLIRLDIQDVPIKGQSRI